MLVCARACVCVLIFPPPPEGERESRSKKERFIMMVSLSASGACGIRGLTDRFFLPEGVRSALVGLPDCVCMCVFMYILVRPTSTRAYWIAVASVP